METRSRFQNVLLAAVLLFSGSAALAQDIAIDRLPRPTAHTPAAAKVTAALAKKDAELRRMCDDQLSLRYRWPLLLGAASLAE
jgi:hypothetical protein